MFISYLKCHHNSNPKRLLKNTKSYKFMIINVIAILTYFYIKYILTNSLEIIKYIH